MATRQHSRRRTRCLLLLAAAGAGIGISLALDSAAHAADTTPHPDQPILHTAITERLDAARTRHHERVAALRQHHRELRAAAQQRHQQRLNTLRDRHTDSPRERDQPQPADTGRATTQPHRGVTSRAPHRTAPRPHADRPRPVTDTVRAVTDHLDQATQQLPILGPTVDTVTDVTDALLDTTTTLLPLPILDAAHPILSHTLLGVTPQTAPEPAAPGSPTPTAAGSGAPTPTTAEQHHPNASDIHPAGTRKPHRWHDMFALRAGDNPGQHHPPAPSVGGDCTDQPAAITSNPFADGTVTNRWTPVCRWHHSITTYMHHHAGRSPAPSPPSG